jgi:hemerythrin-like domain-containing protein
MAARSASGAVPPLTHVKAEKREKARHCRCSLLLRREAEEGNEMATIGSHGATGEPVDPRSLDPHRASARDDANAVLSSLTEHLPLHIADEEEDLFPALERHCAGEDGFERMRVQLSKEHATDDTLVGTLKADLRTLSEGKSLADEANFAAKAEAFAELQERHLAWENASVLPLAHSRLTTADLIAIGRSMAARRGVDYPG